MVWHKALTSKVPWKKKNKYNAKACVHNGEAFRSGLERDVFTTLQLMERAGIIRDIQREQSIQLTPSIKHKLDFTVVDVISGHMYGVEAKGMSCPTWALKKRLYADFSPFRVEIWKAVRGGGVDCVETINPGKHKIVDIDY